MQSETVQLLRTDPSSSEEEHFRIMLVQTEVERVKFIVRSYLRTRLFKVFSSFLLFFSDATSFITDREVCSVYHDQP